MSAVRPSGLYSTCKARRGGGQLGLNATSPLRHFATRTGAHLLDVADLQQALEEFLVAQPRVPQDSTARLDGFDDLVALVAREREPCRVGIDLHRPAQGLLRARRHRVRLVEDYELVAAEREGDLLLREGLDPVPDDVDSTGRSWREEVGRERGEGGVADVLMVSLLTARRTHSAREHLPCSSHRVVRGRGRGWRLSFRYRESPVGAKGRLSWDHTTNASDDNQACCGVFDLLK